MKKHTNTKSNGAKNTNSMQPRRRPEWGLEVRPTSVGLTAPAVRMVVFACCGWDKEADKPKLSLFPVLAIECVVRTDEQLLDRGWILETKVHRDVLFIHDDGKIYSPETYHWRYASHLCNRSVTVVVCTWPEEEDAAQLQLHKDRITKQIMEDEKCLREAVEEAEREAAEED